MLGMDHTIRSRTAAQDTCVAGERLAAEVDADPHAAVGAVRTPTPAWVNAPLRMLARWVGEFIHAVSIWSGL